MSDILVVDDTPENIRFLSRMLQEQGYKVRKATNGKMALTAVNTLNPDLILLDINMPNMDGYEVCKQLKQNSQTSKIPIIFLSALDTTEDKLKAFSVGGADYVTKPFKFAEILARIQHQITIQNLQKQLQTQNNQLQQTLDELTKTQLQLIQQSKMSSLGQLVAGIAHEMNNPINFIAGNINPACNYVQDLVNLINLYEQEFPNTPDSIQEEAEQIDLNFLREDLINLMVSMKTGANRIKAVVSSLRTFSRLDEAELKDVNLHEDIDNTLMLLQHRLNLKAKQTVIEVIKNYGNLPLVYCYASELNQVFFNILNNAIDALQAKETEQYSANPTISITTELESAETAIIRIKDNGIGIPEEHYNNLFEPFFTTKKIGKGMGLGLATSYQIVVDKHQGKLTYHSIVGQGTEFMIIIPVTNRCFI